jgi:hypothetical protein
VFSHRFRAAQRLWVLFKLFDQSSGVAQLGDAAMIGFYFAARLMGAAALAAMFGSEALALKAQPNEKAEIEACEKRLCNLVAKKSPTTGQFTCNLNKTWAGKDIDKGSKSSSLAWGFGDARCSVNLRLENGAIVSAVKDRKATLQFPQHTVTCIVERKNNPTIVVAQLSPKADLENGRVQTVRVNLEHLRASTTIKILLKAAVGLVDGVGILHRPLVNSINKLLHEKCPKVAAGKK